MDRDTERRLWSAIMRLPHDERADLNDLVDEIKQIIGPACESCRQRHGLTMCLRCGATMVPGGVCAQCKGV